MGFLALLLLTTPITVMAQRPLSLAGRSVVCAPRGIVATSQPLATTAGLAVLPRGGNAIDAAVTAAAVLSATEPMMTGIGGDMFAMVWIGKEHRLVALNASGRAGTLMRRDELLRRDRSAMPTGGIETVTVPGWDALLNQYGTLSLAEALAPAIRYAEEGFPLTPIIAADWAAQNGLLQRDAGAPGDGAPHHR
jgi:gamma-glutamyltranspeptidase/glutathione hydrolase